MSDLHVPVTDSVMEDSIASDTPKDGDGYQDKFMDLAFNQAREALAAGEVPIGCVFVTDMGEVIAEGRNEVNLTKNATRHAEMCAVDMVQSKGSTSMYTKLNVYVNVEPCIMCAAALMKVKVKSIFFGCANDKFGGCGSVGNLVEILSKLDTSHKVVMSGGHRASEAVDLLKEFYNGENPNAPNPKVKGVRLKKSA